MRFKHKLSTCDDEGGGEAEAKRWLLAVSFSTGVGFPALVWDQVPKKRRRKRARALSLALRLTRRRQHTRCAG